MSANPFGGLARGRAGASKLGIGPGWLAPLVLIGCLVLAAGVVSWRATRRATEARAHARSEAVALRRALEHQFGEAIASAELLGVMARNGRGAVPGFQETARELLANHPVLATVELQPSGVVTAIAPWAGNERAIGCNTFRDGPHRLGAQSARQRRSTTLVGPLRLYHSEPGVVAYCPVFFAGPDGREAFWGFTAASIRLQDALVRAGVNEFAIKGYQFSFFFPSSGRQAPIVLAGRNPVLPDALLEAVRFQNLEFRLALEPRGGWLDRTELGLDVAVAMLASGLAALVLLLWSKRTELEAASVSLSEQLEHEAEDRKHAQDEFQFEKERSVAAQAELERLRAARQQAEANLAQAHARLQEAERSATEKNEATQARLQQAEARVGELELQLDAAARSAREESHGFKKELASAAVRIAELEADERAGRTRLAEAQSKIASLTTQLTEATQKAAAAQAAADAATALVAEARAAAVTTARPPEPVQVEKPLTSDPPRALPAPPQAPDSSTPPAPSSTTPFPEDESAPLTPPASSPAPESRTSVSQPLPKPSSAEGPAPALPATGPGPEEKKRPHRSAPSPAREAQIVLPFLEAPAPKPATGSSPKASSENTAAVSSPARTGPSATVSQSERERSIPASEASGAVSSLDVGALRQAAHEIVPLLGDHDPGAQDCLAARAGTFRAAFANGTAFEEFAEAVQRGDFRAALEQLRRAAKRHGVTV